jgi:hypothetical protein
MSGDGKRVDVRPNRKEAPGMPDSWQGRPAREELIMTEIDTATTEGQTALALAALTLAFVHVLQEIGEDEEPLVTLQRKIQVEQTRLRQTPGADKAVDMLRFVIHALRNPDLIKQPDD